MSNRPFERLAFLSDEVEQHRADVRRSLPGAFDETECLFAEVTAELSAVHGDFDRPYILAVGFWARSFESCQGAVLLAERGLQTSALAVLRTAFECAFLACALWRRPDIAERIQAHHDAARIKQAQAMLLGDTSTIPADGLAELRAIAAETAPTGPSITAWEAASMAGLQRDYDAAYRGLGLAGAHATMRSLDDFFDFPADGPVAVELKPVSSRLEWLLKVTRACLRCGLDRYREVRR